MSRKSQLEPSFNWFIGLALIFFVGIGWMVLTKAFISLDDAVTPRINDSSFEGTGKSPIDTLKLTRRAWVAFPLILITGIIIYLVMASLKQDPNYPYQ